MKKIKTVVTQDYDVMKPFIVRDSGDVPPILFFHFKEIKPEVTTELNTTVQDDIINVENGFFVPMTRGAVLENRPIFMTFMATIMATLTTVGIAKELESVTIALSGKAIKTDKKNKQASEANVFIVSGINSKGDRATKAQEVKMRMGVDEMVCDLVDTDFLDDDLANAANTFLEGFFDAYDANVTRIPEDKKNFEFLDGVKEQYETHPAEFTAELIDAATHAVELFETIKKTE